MSSWAKLRNKKKQWNQPTQMSKDIFFSSNVHKINLNTLNNPKHFKKRFFQLPPKIQTINVKFFIYFLSHIFDIIFWMFFNRIYIKMMLFAKYFLICIHYILIQIIIR